MVRSYGVTSILDKYGVPYEAEEILWLFVFGFNNMPTLIGHFVSSHREREKRDTIDSKADERESQGRKENEWKWRNSRKKKTPPLPFPAARIAGLAQL